MPMRRFQFILEFQASDEVEAGFFIETKFAPLVKEMQEARDAFGYVKEITRERRDSKEGDRRS